MTEQQKKKNPWIKRILVAGLLGLVAAAVAIWFIFTEKFADTSESKSAYTVNAMDLINEFQKSDSIASVKYREQIVTVNGRVSELEPADTTINVKMTDTLSGSYIIFAFQQQHLNEAKQLKEGDSVSIKGSCSGGVYSEILETHKIDFKRCAVDKK